MSKPRTNKLRDLLRSGKPTLGTHVVSTWPSILEIIGLTGTMDYVEFTSQYGPYDLFSLENLQRAADLHGLATMIKIDSEPKTYLAQRSIAAGFHSVLFADLRSIREVDEAIRAVKSEPRGKNGWFDNRAQGFGLTLTPKQVSEYYDELVIAVMVEKKSLYDEIEDLMNLEDLDMVQFGPGDFSLSLGTADPSSEAVREAQTRTIKLAVKHEKHPRVELGGSPKDIEKAMKRFAKLGVTDFAVGSDYEIIFNYINESGGLARRILQQAR